MLGAAVPYDDDDLELAFQLHVADLVIAADLVTTSSEAAFVDRHFPRSLLEERGFVDPVTGARTPAFDDAAVEALSVLATRRTRAEKLDLLEACYKIAVVDRSFRLGEGAVVLMAARLLGLSDDDFDGFIADHARAAGGPSPMTAAMLDDHDDDDEG